MNGKTGGFKGIKRITQVSINLFLLAGLLPVYVNCSGFRADPMVGLNRNEFFSSRTVFNRTIIDPEMQEGSGGNRPADGRDGSADPNGTGGSTGGPTGGTAGGSRDGSSTGSSTGGSAGGSRTGSSSTSSGNVSFYCSYGLSQLAGMNIMRAIREGKTAYIGYRKSGEPLACATVVDLNQLVSTKNVTFPSCAQASDRSYELEITLTKDAVDGFAYDKGSFSGSSLMPRSNLDAGNGKIGVIYALNDELSGGLPPGFTENDYGDQSKCDRKASPLVVQLTKTPQLLHLSSPIEGIMFDILGANAVPAAHTKQLISWLLPESRQDNYFLVLPNSSGAVEGIDQLFGDNTRGPDGKFAANGYEALRKHDGSTKLGGIDHTQRDGVINNKDAVFNKLRLWHDLNGDGLAQSNELQSLSSRGVKAIDLNYDPNYLEVDRYGNETRLKSIVQMEDGSANLIYDLWFHLRGT